MKKEATISDCGRYRYTLSRIWNEKLRLILFIGLNPSTADAEEDDPTIRRMTRFALDWRFGGMLVGNLFAYRATDPKDLTECEEPVGRFNNYWLEIMSQKVSIKVACWGAHGTLLKRDKQVLSMLDSFFIFGLNQDGTPKHPLYLPADTGLLPWTTTGDEMP